jgi:hypothetical protein
MDIELPRTVTIEVIQRALSAVAPLRALLVDAALPAGLTADAVDALLATVEGVAEAASGDNADVSPSEAAARLRVARPSVMRLIARGELSSRKENGHYVLSPRELRAFQVRLTTARREALGELATMAEQFGY